MDGACLLSEHERSGATVSPVTRDRDTRTTTALGSFRPHRRKRETDSCCRYVLPPLLSLLLLLLLLQLLLLLLLLRTVVASAASVGSAPAAPAANTREFSARYLV